MGGRNTTLQTPEWVETEEFHPLSKEARFKVKVMVNGERKMVVDKATKRWFKYGPEELNRQFEEQRLHDDFGYSWRRIKPEALVKIGSEPRFADIAVLRNPDLPAEPSNYLVLVELKRTGGDAGGAKAQLQSYMGSSNAVQGMFSDVRSCESFLKAEGGKILQVSKLSHRNKLKEDLLRGSDLRELHVDNRVFKSYCDGMDKILSRLPQDTKSAKYFVEFWRRQVQTLRKYGRVDPF